MGEVLGVYCWTCRCFVGVSDCDEGVRGGLTASSRSRLTSRVVLAKKSLKKAADSDG